MSVNWAKPRPIDIEFVKLTYATPHRSRKQGMKQILKGVSGRFRSGELTAILGPSGAGKTSLFHILTGFHRANVTGEVRYLGTDGSVDFEEYRKALRYIQQEDKLYPSFTVIEAMRIAAELKLGVHVSAADKCRIIEDTLKTFNMTRVRDVRCDLLSGGQQKRLCIAVELVDNPGVVFLDEPTTGLDSLLSTECIATLKTLAADQRTVVCVIHQPSAAIFEAFDKVYFLADGKCVYQGPPGETVSYFRELGLCCPLYHNPADYVTEVISNKLEFIEEPEFVEESVDKVDSAWVERRPAAAERTRLFVFEFHKFIVLLKRCVLQLIRQWSDVQMKIGVSILLGIVLGVMFRDSGNNASKSFDNIRFMICSCVVLSYTTLMPAVLRFPLELQVLQKEHFNNWYHLRTYFAAVNFVGIPYQVGLSLIYCGISFVLTGQPMELMRFLMFYLIGVCTALTAESIGLLFGTLFNPVNGTFFGAATLAVMISLAGIVPLFQHMSAFMYNISYLSFLRYSLEGMTVAVYGFGREKLPCPAGVDYCHLSYPRKIMSELCMDDSRYWTNVGVLLVNFFVIRILSCFALKRRLSQPC
ncbi:ATP-binding cassette sub-family G member 1-like [Neodiprion fabricii]|uniref:ATP-binding cassette sub-family G member 1-like n=1 Tax=Neodiprion fabricii TaxID=2872261 RepID=UPI001ED91019|nr:ATP-binding cassette sub-family G member 1-like [Neodiprion fabricii]